MVAAGQCAIDHEKVQNTMARYDIKPFACAKCGTWLEPKKTERSELKREIKEEV